MPLILLIAIVWLAVVTVVVALCLAAARADAAVVRSGQNARGRAFLPGVIVWRDLPELDLEKTAGAHRERVTVGTGRP